MRVSILGQFAGPMNGQSRLTGAYRDGRKGTTYGFEFWGHKSLRGPFLAISQVVKGLAISIFGQVDVAYIATSRSNFGMFRDLLLLLPFILTRTPIVSHVHGAEFDDFYLDNPRFSKVKAFYIRSVTSFIFVNEVFVPDDPKLSHRSTFVRNPIPHFAVDLLSQDPKTQHANGGRRSFGFISTFAPEKGIEQFLDAADAYSDRADFVVAGGPSIADEAYGNRILERIKGMPKVDYLGYLTDPSAFYERCDFMIFPTNFASETSSLVVIEALATRTHPIVRRHNRLTDIFGSAPVSWFGDREELERQIESCLSMPDTDLAALQNRGQPWVRQTFPTEAEWVQKVEAIVAEATRNGR